MAQQTFDVNNAAASPVTFLLAQQDKKSTKYMAPTSSLMEPTTCDIQLDLKAPGNQGSSRITVAFSKTKLDTVGLPKTGRISLQIVVPSSTAITASDMNDLRAHVVDYISTANFPLLLDGIVP